MAKYTVESLSRLQAAFNMLVPNIAYVPGVLANNALQTILSKKDTSKNKSKVKIPPTGSYEGSLRKQFDLRSDYAINYTFDEILVSSPLQYSFPLDPLVDIAMGNDLLRTPIQGGGEVVELIGERNHSIRIRGILWEGNALYPRKSVKELLAVFKKKQVLEVSSYLFNLFGIDSLIIEEVSFPAMPGFEDTQPYEIMAISYKAVELEITSDQVSIEN